MKRSGCNLLTQAILIILLAAFCMAKEGRPQDPKPQAPAPAPAQEAKAEGDRQARPAAEAASPTDPKPYDKVITKDAKSKRGVFAIHQVKDKWFYEIPKSELGRDFLWAVQFSNAPMGEDRGGRVSLTRVIRWERNNNKVYLREIKYGMVAEPNAAIARGVAASNSNTILAAFNVEAVGQDEAAVIDVTKLFTSEMKELGPSKGTIDASRSFIDRIAVFPQNVEVEATATFTAPPPPMPPRPGMAPGAPRPPVSSTYVLHYSMVKLPEKPMMPRLFDDRIGYFPVAQIDFGRDEQKVVRRQYIAHWRLEKKDPSAAMSEPVKPIIYYIDPATPKQFVPYLKEAVEKWQVAFEAAGFKNAILAKEVPSPEEDSEWSAEDVRNTVIRWLPSTTENAMGPHVADPRSGEILNGNISVYHNILNLVRSWYFIQVSPLDARAQKLPLPDDLMGKLLGYVVTHEVGHTLGLMHNMKASSQYPVDKLRDPKWVHTMGHTPSIMDYARFNYVAQPEDGVDPNDGIPGIGVYDKWAIAWGYKPIPNAKSPDDEFPTLNEWAREQDKNPYLRYADDAAAFSGYDPGEQMEAVGDADAVKSTALGVKNLERVAANLLSATTSETGQPYEDLQLMYGRLIGQWTTEMAHVVRIVGGISRNNKHIGQEGTVYEPVSSARQREAVKFLNQNAFTTPRMFLNPEILNRIDPVGAPARIGKAQGDLLRSLLAPQRLLRIDAMAATNQGTAIGVGDLLRDVRTGVWSELYGAGPVKVDTFRRNLQRSYIEHLDKQLSSSDSAAVHAFYRDDLLTIRADLKSAMSRATERSTRAHLRDIEARIAKTLDPKTQAPAANAPNPHPGISNDDARLLPCWHDFQMD
ncbi:MAG TPA: zinc-dependent metalloprotease [Clostridia bacterium]|nr:zinc-dependent metalloprotease [Clostridia bacterium]